MTLARSLLVLVASASMLGAQARPARRAAVPPRIAAKAAANSANSAAELVRSIDSAMVRARPERATAEGLPGADHGALSDNSPEGLRRWRAQEDSWLRALRESAPGNAASTAERRAVRDALERSVALRVCRDELRDIRTSPDAWLPTLASAMQNQPAGTPETRRLALMRAHGIGRFVDREIANLREGVRAKVFAPSPAVDAMVQHIDSLLALRATASPFYAPARRDQEVEFRHELGSVYFNEMMPALRRYRWFLVNDYRAALGAELSVTPAAEDRSADLACQRARLRSLTGHDIDLATLRRVAEQELTEATRALRQLGDSMYGDSLPAAIHARLRTAGALSGLLRPAMVQRTWRAIAQARDSTASYVPTMPSNDLLLDTASSESRGGSLPGTLVPSVLGASTYLLSAAPPALQLLPLIEARAFHETYPGRLLEHSASRARASSKRRLALPLLEPLAWPSEWAAYSESMADALGLYPTPVSRLGMLASRELRAALAIADIEAHASGWGVDSITAYLARTTVLAPEDAARAAREIYSRPGWPTGELWGSLNLRRAELRARAAAGVAFNLRDFHTRILAAGPWWDDAQGTP